MNSQGEARRVAIARVYDAIAAKDGHRVLIDRLWPRGVAKASAPIDEWCQLVAPSADLRKWYAHDRAKFAEFARRYLVELKAADVAGELDRLRGIAADRGLVLVTAVRDVPISAATVLRGLLVS